MDTKIIKNFYNRTVTAVLLISLTGCGLFDLNNEDCLDPDDTIKVPITFEPSKDTLSIGDTITINAKANATEVNKVLDFTNTSWGPILGFGKLQQTDTDDFIEPAVADFELIIEQGAIVIPQGVQPNYDLGARRVLLESVNDDREFNLKIIPLSSGKYTISFDSSNDYIYVNEDQPCDGFAEVEYFTQQNNHTYIYRQHLVENQIPFEESQVDDNYYYNFIVTE
uniref:Uncharacterized protein n=1 Tax=Roseihalotalea indica TaxID=2867963 RepID=A0AA49JIC9_9BACT|nr:hypothetical protein K4G66_18690 [Tunicatimonas sp. TK19036]